MAEIKRGRWTAQIEGSFVVFLIGARFEFMPTLALEPDPAAA
jgi:hypothetical protein